MCGGLRAPPNPQHPLTRSCRAGEHAPTLQGAGFGVQPCPQHPNAWGTREGHGCAPNQQQKGHGDPQSTPRKGKESSRADFAFVIISPFVTTNQKYGIPAKRNRSQNGRTSNWRAGGGAGPFSVPKGAGAALRARFRLH